ncbi:hypothetical protein [Streptomyces sp. NBC_01483]|uniref:hypothetical protein n=1 Tax=Streptomyces sp. NBC_01483 TaxID=2903883 RepID=UPI002E370444|nr:hypothetical protein [Streptomyces sp. NBC_01483]
MLAPDGPLPFTLPEPTDGLVAPTVDFMLAGLPQMQGPELTATVRRPLVLDLTGRHHHHPPPRDRAGRAADRGTRCGRPRVHSAALDFIAWATTRTPWRDHCRITGTHPPRQVAVQRCRGPASGAAPRYRVLG